MHEKGWSIGNSSDEIEIERVFLFQAGILRQQHHHLLQLHRILQKEGQPIEERRNTAVHVSMTNNQGMVHYSIVSIIDFKNSNPHKGQKVISMSESSLAGGTTNQSLRI